MVNLVSRENVMAYFAFVIMNSLTGIMLLLCLSLSSVCSFLIVFLLKFGLFPVLSVVFSYISIVRVPFLLNYLFLKLCYFIIFRGAVSSSLCTGCYMLSQTAVNATTPLSFLYSPLSYMLSSLSPHTLSPLLLSFPYGYMLSSGAGSFLTAISHSFSPVSSILPCCHITLIPHFLSPILASVSSILCGFPSFLTATISSISSSSISISSAYVANIMPACFCSFLNSGASTTISSIISAFSYSSGSFNAAMLSALGYSPAALIFSSILFPLLFSGSTLCSWLPIMLQPYIIFPYYMLSSLFSSSWLYSFNAATITFPAVSVFAPGFYSSFHAILSYATTPAVAVYAYVAPIFSSSFWNSIISAASHIMLPIFSSSHIILSPIFAILSSCHYIFSSSFHATIPPILSALYSGAYHSVSALYSALSYSALVVFSPSWLFNILHHSYSALCQPLCFLSSIMPNFLPAPILPTLNPISSPILSASPNIYSSLLSATTTSFPHFPLFPNHLLSASNIYSSLLPQPHIIASIPNSLITISNRTDHIIAMLPNTHSAPYFEHHIIASLNSVSPYSLVSDPNIYSSTLASLPAFNFSSPTISSLPSHASTLISELLPCSHISTISSHISELPSPNFSLFSTPSHSFSPSPTIFANPNIYSSTHALLLLSLVSLFLLSLALGGSGLVSFNLYSLVSSSFNYFIVLLLLVVSASAYHSFSLLYVAFYTFITAILVLCLLSHSTLSSLSFSAPISFGVPIIILVPHTIFLSPITLLLLFPLRSLLLFILSCLVYYYVALISCSHVCELLFLLYFAYYHAVSILWCLCASPYLRTPRIILPSLSFLTPCYHIIFPAPYSLWALLLLPFCHTA
jgi:hypothetical protein